MKITETKSGLTRPIICKNCGKKVGIVKFKRKLRWRTIKWAIGLSLAFEIIANSVVYLLFSKVF